MAGRVLVTRPEPGAAATAARLKQAGYEAVLLPLSRTVALPVDLVAVRGPFDAVAVTSANALSHAPRELIDMLSRTRCFAVGARTAKAARDAGFAAVDNGPGDAAGLAQAIIAELPAGARIAYLAGRVRMPDFERHMREAGFALQAIETYDTERLQSSETALRDLLENDAPDAVLLYSAKAAEAFAMLAHAHPHLATGALLCLSPRVAASLQGLAGAHIFTAATPDEDALLARLAAASPAVS